MNDTGLMLTSNSMPIMEIAQVLERRQLMVQFVGAALIDGTDYGIIPGTGTNKTLLKPGAEKLCTYFGLRPTFEAVQTVEDWTGRDHDGEPFFYYWMRCRLIRNGEIMAEGDGSCNSHESKYRWRWATAEDLPAGTDKTMLKQRGGKISEFGFSVDKADTAGKYGKPTSYWQQFTVAIANKTARKTTKLTKAGASYDAWEIDSTLYRIPSDDIASQVNTILKMAQKRALTAATLIGVNASEFFTQDLDDLVEPDVIEGTARIVPEPARPAQPQAPTQQHGLHAGDIADALAEAKRRKAQQPSAQPAAPTNGKPTVSNQLNALGPMKPETRAAFEKILTTADGLPLAAPVAILSYSDADDAEFNALGKAPLSMSAPGASNAELAGLPAEQHWIDAPDTRKKFFAWIGSQGMQDNEAYVALNCKTMHEYTGTRQDAMDAILAYLKRKFAAQARRETPAAA